MSQQVSGKRMLEKYEIEYNGLVFNCLECNNDNCCSTTDNNAKNKVACQKCRCQNLYTVKDGTRAGSEPVSLKCTGCTSNMSEAECNSYSFLNNKIIQNFSIVDCSNNMITAGANNQINDVVMKSTCNTSGPGGPTKVNNLQTSQSSNGVNWTMIGIGAGVIILFIILILLFR